MQSLVFRAGVLFWCQCSFCKLSQSIVFADHDPGSPVSGLGGTHASKRGPPTQTCLLVASQSDLEMAGSLSTRLDTTQTQTEASTITESTPFLARGSPAKPGSVSVRVHCLQSAVCVTMLRFHARAAHFPLIDSGHVPNRQPVAQRRQHQWSKSSESNPYHKWNRKGETPESLSSGGRRPCQTPHSLCQLRARSRQMPVDMCESHEFSAWREV